MRSFLFLFRFRILKTNRFSFSFYKTKKNHFRSYFRFRNKNRSDIMLQNTGLVAIYDTQTKSSVDL